jgi:sec-independent protein translocase protein TatA
MPIGIPELLIVLVIILVIFGPKRLPMLGRQLGGGLREFKDSVTSRAGRDDGDDADADAKRPGLATSAQTDPLDPTPDGTQAAAGARDETVTRPGR